MELLLKIKENKEKRRNNCYKNKDGKRIFTENDSQFEGIFVVVILFFYFQGDYCCCFRIIILMRFSCENVIKGIENSVSEFSIRNQLKGWNNWIKGNDLEICDGNISFIS